MELLKRYKEDIEKDLIINDFNLKEVQLRLPARKHFWAARLIDAKIEHQRLIKQKKVLKSTLASEIVSKSPVRITKGEAECAADTSQSVIELTDSIKEYEYVIEYLEKVEKIMGGMGFDIRNIIAIQELERL